MDPITQQTVLAAAGAGGDKVYVDDVFRTTLYKGTSTGDAAGTQTIISGIDNTEKSMLWIKDRDQSYPHYVYDTVRGSNKFIRTSSNSNEQTDNSGPGGSAVIMKGFTNNGFIVEDAQVNANGDSIAAWNFKAAPGFFDVVTWTGSGSDQTISHNLESVPGCIMVKCTSHTSEWYVYHRSLPTATQNWLRLSNNAAANGPVGQDVWGPPTSTTFKADTYLSHSTAGRTYVAYVFAHDAAQFGTAGNESIIKCGSYTGSAANGLVTVDVGFEPQWVLIKKYSATGSGTAGNWVILDNMRGAADNASDQAVLQANNNNIETSPVGGGLRLFVTNKGFGWRDQAQSYNISTSGANYIYMAIRRPHKPPEAGTEVFNTVQNNNTLISGTKVDFGITPDMHIASRTTSAMSHWITSRQTGGDYMFTNSLATESNFLSSYNKEQTTVEYTGQASNDTGTYLHQGFKRAAGFFDVVAYTGNGASGHVINHNLNAVPEMMWVKNRDSCTYNRWYVQHSGIGDGYYIQLQDDGAAGSSTIWSSKTKTTITPAGNPQNETNVRYIAYLFATLPGVSKVGSYTGNGGSSAFNVDCGFTNGARFVLIKDATSTNDWYFWDTVRGMTSSAAPYLRLNVQGQQSTSNWVETQTSGFKVTTGTNANLRINVSGNTYIFYAIA